MPNKNEFARASLSYNAVEIGVFDLTVNSVYSEIDVTDTLTNTGDSEFLGARKTHTISFSTYKLAGAADLVLNLTSLNVAIFTASDGTNTTTYTGALVLLSKDITGNIDGAVQLAYSGKISGALTEAQT